MYGNNKCMKIIMKGLKMSKFEIQHFTLCDGWINTWTITNEDGQDMPEYFDSYKDAEEDLMQFLMDEDEAYANGYIESRYKSDEFRIVEVQA